MTITAAHPRPLGDVEGLLEHMQSQQTSVASFTDPFGESVLVYAPATGEAMLCDPSSSEVMVPLHDCRAGYPWWPLQPISHDTPTTPSDDRLRAAGRRA